jgi:hypothetical protein
MTTLGKLFLAVGVFLVVVTTGYWFRAYEDAGTTLLAGCALLCAILVGFAWRRGWLRDPPDVPEDRPDAVPSDVAGQEVGSFPFASAWPIVLAAGAVFVGVGLLYTLVLLPVGLILGTIAVLGLMRESRA